MNLNINSTFKAIPLIICAMLVWAACQSPKEKALKEIKNLESNDSVFSLPLMTELKTAYVNFSNTYPDDALAPEYLFKGAQRAIVIQQPNEAVELLQQLIDKYPKSGNYENALFLLAYTCENNLNDMDRAKTGYEAFIKKFPKGELADDARFALENLGKSAEEVLKNLPAQ